MSISDDPVTAPSPVPRIPSQRQIADYICVMTGQLARMAREGRLSTLAYLLEMTRDEADVTRRALPKPESGDLRD